MKPEEFQKAKRALVRKDPSLRALFQRHRGLSFSPRLERSPYESLVRAIAHQQLHGKAAETILGRMLDCFSPGAFPKPEELHQISSEKLRDCGFSQSKVKSIKDIAAKTLQGVVPTSREIMRLSNEDIIERLTEIYGVGRWTVEMLLIFQLGRLDIWPADDFGVRNGFRIWKRKREMPTAKQIKPVGDKWAPYQTVVALHLWREADLGKIKK